MLIIPMCRYVSKDDPNSKSGFSNSALINTHICDNTWEGSACDQDNQESLWHSDVYQSNHAFLIITSGCLCLFLPVHVAIPGCHDRVSGSAPGLLLYVTGVGWGGLDCGGKEDMGSLGSLIQMVI